MAAPRDGGYEGVQRGYSSPGAQPGETVRSSRLMNGYESDHSGYRCRPGMARTIEGYAMMQGLTLDEVFVERGVSGSRPIGERPEGARMLGTVRSGDVIITPKLDRMFRSALDALDVLARLKDRDVSLHMIDLGG